MGVTIIECTEIIFNWRPMSSKNRYDSYELGKDSVTGIIEINSDHFRVCFEDGGYKDIHNINQAKYSPVKGKEKE